MSSEIDVTVKGVHYTLRAYNEWRNEWDLAADRKMIKDSKPYSECLQALIELIKD